MAWEKDMGKTGPTNPLETLTVAFNDYREDQLSAQAGNAVLRLLFYHSELNLVAVI